MRIAYCTNVRLPSERAHGHQIAQVCDALVRLGHEVAVFVAHRTNAITESFSAYYGADQRIRLISLGSFDPIGHPLFPGVTGLWALNALLRRNLARILRSSPPPFDLLYTRSPAILSPLLRSGMPVILELHQLPRFGRRRFARQCGRCRLVVCLTHAMKEQLLRWGVPSSRLVVAGDAVDLRRFRDLPSPREARSKRGITTDRLVVGYVGRLKTLGMEKGVRTLLEMLAACREDRAFFGLIVGGPEGDKREYEQIAASLGLTAEDVSFTGPVPPAQVPQALAACDILVMPFPDLPHYRRNMSPLKMFEYMAAERPIIASDLPTLRDVLSGETAFFCEPGDAKDVAAVLRFIREHPEEARKRAKAARSLVERHTWEERMKRILGGQRA